MSLVTNEPLRPEPHRLVSADERLRQLIGLQLLFNMAALGPFLFFDDRTIQNAFGWLLNGQIMLLAFWAGILSGTLRDAMRIIGLGSLFFAFIGVLTLFLQHPADSANNFVIAYAVFSFMCFFLVSLSAAAFRFVFGLAGLRSAAYVDAAESNVVFQFSLRQLVGAITVAGVFLGIGRLVAGSPLALFLVPPVLFVNSACAAWAALSVGHIRWRLAVATAVALFLGYLTPSPPSPFDHEFQFTGFIIAAAIVGGSLLVVRSCGYRLVVKESALHESDASADPNIRPA